jgi:flagellar protein FliS
VELQERKEASMNAMLSSYGAMAYRQVNRHSGVEGANPHRLIDMLMEGALDKISAAKGFILRNEVGAKGVAISKAVSMIAELRASLNMEAGGELAQNLDNLYDYMQRQLTRANIEDDQHILNEVTTLLSGIRDAWNSIPQAQR